MALEVIVPALGEVVEEVVILRWLKAEGERVRKGEPLFEVESEKVTTEIPSPGDGILGKILFPEGSRVKVTKVAAVLLSEGEALPSAFQVSQPPAAAAVAPSGVGGPSPKGEEKIRVAPVARKMAEKEGVDLSKVKPTGPHGTIMKKDVEDYLAQMRRQKEAAPSPPPAPIFSPAAPAGGRTVPLTMMRETIAKRMAKSASTVPHIYLFSEIEMDALLQMREMLKASHKESTPFPISINDFILKATAMTLREFPYLNAQYQDGSIRLIEEINIGLAVALEEGLTVPAISSTDRLGLREIAQQRMDLVERARQGKLQKAEIERGTFTVTSLASFGICYFTAIINPPQSGILSIGMTQEKLVMKEGKIEVCRFAVFGLSVDHRVADGAYGAAFLEALKKKLENPLIAFLQY
jgi:pyruvate dehydrogenase E2 component (dihydrolipoamide acetyltransferase)